MPPNRTSRRTLAARASRSARATISPRAAVITSRPRDREQTQQRLLDAVGRVLAREGFGAIGINAIAKEAGVDKVLIYRYFGGLPELLAFYGGSGQFWPDVDELLGADDAAAAASLPQQLDWLIERFIEALRQRPLTIEILAWETVVRNELTAVLESVREEWGQTLEARLRQRFPAVERDVPALMILFTAAIQYLLVRARTIRVYGGIDLHTPEGWARLRAAMGAALHALISPAPPAQPGPARTGSS